MDGNRLVAVGNPLTSEGAAFRWFVVVLLAAISVGIVAKVIGPIPAIFYGMVLIAIVTVIIAKGMIHLLGNPENDKPVPGDDPPKPPPI